MLNYKGDIKIRNLVSFYSTTSCIYFPLLISMLLWTNGIYSAGKYKFGFVILLILVAEMVKYFTSTSCIRAHDMNLGKRHNDKTINSIICNIFGRSKLKSGLETFIVTIFIMALYFIIFILYGAEVFSKHEETLMLSFLLAILTVFPVCLNLGIQSIISLLFEKKQTNKLESLLYQNFCFSLIGAWLGAFVIPLDWDRPWQVWPIPCSLGALLGYTLSHFIMLLEVNSYFKTKNK